MHEHSRPCQAETQESSKICFKCEQKLALHAFYKHSRMKDGHLNKCKECAKNDARKHREENKKYYQKYDKSRINLPHRVEARKEYQKNNREKANKWNKKWAAKNKDYTRANVINRRARKKLAEGKYCAKDMAKKLLLQKKKCALCKTSIAKKYHVDHIMPLALGGSNWPTNIQLLCPTCNQNKGAKHPIAYAQEIGLLL